jgi:hypothetical protein
MRKHSMRWRCASKSHKDMFFNTRDDYISHLKEKHRKVVTDQQIAVLADRSLQLNGLIFPSCPLCGVEEKDNSGSLVHHIAGHLRSLALKSLPPVDYGDEQTEEVERGTGTDCESKIVQHDPDSNVFPKFDSYDEHLDYFLPKIYTDSSTPGTIQQSHIVSQDSANISVDTILTEVKLERLERQTDSSMYDTDNLSSRIIKWLRGVYSVFNRGGHTNANDAS